MHRTSASLSVLLALVSLATAGPASGQDRPDLVGSWILSVEDSDFGMTTVPDSVLMTIDRADERLEMNRRIFFESRGIDVAFDFDMPIDGKPHEATSTNGPLQVTPEWEGTLLRLSTTAESNVGPLPVVDRFRLADDGTLVAEREVEAPGGTVTSIMVFERRK